MTVAGDEDSPRTMKPSPKQTLRFLASVNTIASDRSPELFGSELFFTSDRAGSSDVFSAPATIPKPGSLALLFAGSMGALLLRRR